jgi:DHA2 family multidrug resistance protein-like MFS transporter
MVEIESGTGVPSPTRSAPAGKWAWLGLAILMMTTLLALLDNGIIFLALPRVTAGLHATNTEALWIADIYAYFSVGCLVTMGRLGDKIGHRKLLMIGAAGFSVFSLLAAFSVSAIMLIVMRALLGICGATMGPSLFALAKEMYPDPRKFATAISLMATSAMIGVSAGPAIGGLLLNTFWWGSVFLIALPVMALVLLAGPFTLRETSNRIPRQLDLASVVLSMVSILLIMYGLTTIANNGWQVSPGIAIAAGLMVGVVFVRRQRRLEEPLLDLRLFGVRSIAATLVMYTLTGIVQGGNSLTLTQHLQLVEGFSPLVASLWMAIPLTAAIGGIHASTILAKRFRPGYVLMGGLLTSAAGELILRETGAPGLVMLVVGLSIVMIGTSPVGALSNQLIMHAAPANKAGSAAALGSTGGDFGSATGVAVFGSLVTVFYSGNVHIPAGVGPSGAAATNTSIIDAGTVARHLPTATANQLISAARDAFSNATDHIATLSLGLFIVLAILVFATLRPILPIGQQEEQQQD